MKTKLVRFIGGAAVLASIALLAISTHAQTDPIPAGQGAAQQSARLEPAFAEATARQASQQSTQIKVCSACGQRLPVVPGPASHEAGYARPQVVYVVQGEPVAWAPAYYGAVCAPRSIDMFGPVAVNPIPYPASYCAPSLPVRALRHLHRN